METPTDKARVVETELRRLGEIGRGGTLQGWFDTQRLDASWPRIAHRIWRLTGELVSERTLRSWHRRMSATPQSAEAPDTRPPAAPGSQPPTATP